MDPQEQADRLRAAARLVDDVVRSLNTNKTPCPHCRISKADRWGEFRAEAMLAGILRKLESLAKAADHDWPSGSGDSE